jgi:hypothetical protein
VLNVRDDREAPLLVSTGRVDHASDLGSASRYFLKLRNSQTATNRHDGNARTGPTQICPSCRIAPVMEAMIHAARRFAGFHDVLQDKKVSQI